MINGEKAIFAYVEELISLIRKTTAVSGSNRQIRSEELPLLPASIQDEISPNHVRTHSESPGHSPQHVDDTSAECV
jgi:hypothetical protein